MSLTSISADRANRVHQKISRGDLDVLDRPLPARGVELIE
jgi:hypothetical protein